jgi:hypothetical protein
VTDHRSDLRVLALLDRRLRDWPTLTVEEASRELGVPGTHLYAPIPAGTRNSRVFVAPAGNPRRPVSRR